MIAVTDIRITILAAVLAFIISVIKDIILIKKGNDAKKITYS